MAWKSAIRFFPCILFAIITSVLIFKIPLKEAKKTFLQHYHRFSYILFRYDLQNIVKKTKKQFLFQQFFGHLSFT